MEKGGRPFTFESIKAIANAFKIDFKQLLDEVVEPTNSQNVEFKKKEHGKEIDDLLLSKNGAEFDYDNSIRKEELVCLIHSLFDYIDDHMEKQIFSPQRLSPNEINVFNRVIEKLGSVGLYIYGGQTYFTKKYEDEIFDIEVAKIWIGREVTIPITKDGLLNSFLTTKN